MKKQTGLWPMSGSSEQNWIRLMRGSGPAIRSRTGKEASLMTFTHRRTTAALAILLAAACLAAPVRAQEENMQAE